NSFNQSFSINSFPTKDKKEEWIKFVNEANNTSNRKWYWKNASKLCSRHFSKCCFSSLFKTRKGINPGHIPRIYFYSYGAKVVKMVRVINKNNGSLTIPSEDLIKVCKKTEVIIRSLRQCDMTQLNRAVITRFCLSELLSDEFLFRNLRMEIEDKHTMDSTHVLELLKKIIATYANILLHYIAKELTLAEHPISIRNQMTRLVIFSGE